MHTMIVCPPHPCGWPLIAAKRRTTPPLYNQSFESPWPFLSPLSDAFSVGIRNHMIDLVGPVLVAFRVENSPCHQDEGDDDGAGVSPYIYAGGSGSSYASENGSSSSDGDAGFDSDSDNEPYYRRVVDVHEEFSRNFGGGGVAAAVADGGLADVEDNDDFDGVSGLSADGSGSGVGVDRLVKRMPPTSGRDDGGDGATETSVGSPFHAGLGEAGVFAWSQKR